MDSEGLWADVRRIMLRGDVFGLAIAVLVGTALVNLLYAVVEYLVIPFGRGLFRERHTSQPLSFPTDLYATYHGYSIPWGAVLTAVLTLALAVLLFVSLKRWLFRESEVDIETGPEFEEWSDWRTCPECLSQIPGTAKRCAFCTSPVEPATPRPQE
jgi:large conductance mechanosensitive channel